MTEHEESMLSRDDEAPGFACDAMLGGVARWLRAAGYDASWEYGIADDDLIAAARRDGRRLLTSDLGILARRVIMRGEIASLFIPGGMSAKAQLSFILAKLGLALRQARCMSCGGELVGVMKSEVRDVVPPKSYLRHDDFTRCGRCGKVFWEGTHWGGICGWLEEAVASEVPRDVMVRRPRP